MPIRPRLGPSLSPNRWAAPVGRTFLSGLPGQECPGHDEPPWRRRLARVGSALPMGNVFPLCQERWLGTEGMALAPNSLANRHYSFRPSVPTVFGSVAWHGGWRVARQGQQKLTVGAAASATQSQTSANKHLRRSALA